MKLHEFSQSGRSSEFQRFSGTCGRLDSEVLEILIGVKPMSADL
jgi:hypothetical protein